MRQRDSILQKLLSGVPESLPTSSARFRAFPKVSRHRWHVFERSRKTPDITGTFSGIPESLPTSLAQFRGIPKNKKTKIVTSTSFRLFTSSLFHLFTFSPFHLFTFSPFHLYNDIHHHGRTDKRSYGVEGNYAGRAGKITKNIAQKSNDRT